VVTKHQIELPVCWQLD